MEQAKVGYLLLILLMAIGIQQTIYSQVDLILQKEIIENIP
jgi:hypothetical protein